MLEASLPLSSARDVFVALCRSGEEPLRTCDGIEGIVDREEGGSVGEVLVCFLSVAII